MTPQQFIAKWQANTRSERSACQEHFIDLCYLLDEPTPNTDPTGATYAFEKGATKATGEDGWADVWRKERFAWEYKGKRKDLDAAHRQLLLYAGALGNPPLLVVSDISRIIVRTNWTNAVSERHDILLADLADPAKRHLLKTAFTDPDRLRPGKTREALTAQAAGEFAGLAERLRQRGHDPEAVAHFVNRLVFCLFADDVGLLPPGLFERMLGAAKKNPAKFTDYAQRLFRAMAERGGEVDFTPVQWFNGGLFDDDAALPLEVADIKAVESAASLDWAEIDPSIMGTLFERGLDPGKRGQLGAHYTDRDKIMRIVEPVVSHPLAEEWERAKGEITVLLERASVAKNPGSRTKAHNEAAARFRTFLDHLRAFRVLDPACGSGNFLYLSLLALKDLEHRAMVEGEVLGFQREFPQVGPEAVLGIELNPYAAELARVSVWIGHIQWARRHGLPAPANPVLRKLDTIECRDALLEPGGNEAAWPDADAVIGNPPFLGDKFMRASLGNSYTKAVRAIFTGRVPGGSDLVCYWFEKARAKVSEARTARVGLVSTNAIRRGANRVVLDRISDTGMIFAAWPDEEWTVEGADVRVSLVCFARKGEAVAPFLSGMPVAHINSDLSSLSIDLSKAKALMENAVVAMQGPTKGGAFEVPGPVARAWLLAPSNPNGRPNSDVVKPWFNGSAVTERWHDMWIIDFEEMSERDASLYEGPFGHVENHVKPARMLVDRDRRKRLWWQYNEPAPGVRAAVQALDRFIVAPETPTHNVFAWLPRGVAPDKNLVVIARDDDTSFGILQSRFHLLWVRALGSPYGNHPTARRYNSTRVFRTFPFPAGLGPRVPAKEYANEPRAARIAEAAKYLNNLRENWLNPAELVRRVPEVVKGFPDRLVPASAEAGKILAKRTLTSLYNERPAWLANAHRDLDSAVAAAYGWSVDILEEDALAGLLALNQERAG